MKRISLPGNYHRKRNIIEGAERNRKKYFFMPEYVGESVTSGRGYVGNDEDGLSSGLGEATKKIYI